MNERPPFSSIESIERDNSLREEKQFTRRAEAIDFIEWMPLSSRAEKIKSVLEQVDDQLFQKLWTTISAEGLTGATFKNLIKEYVGFTATDNDYQEEPGYDNLDIFINKLLFFETFPQPIKDLGPEMVYYQKTPARIVFDLVGSADFTREDIFVDIGCGMGQVAFLVHLLAGITTKGIEFEPAYCDYARQCAAKLHLSHLTFINVDARAADYSDGTIFFMYTPFMGKLLHEVLEALRRESLRRSIKIITYGPCTAEVARESWLKRLTPGENRLYTLTFFRSL